MINLFSILSVFKSLIEKNLNCDIPGMVNRTFENRTQSNSIRGLSSIEFDCQFDLVCMPGMYIRKEKKTNWDKYTFSATSEERHIKEHITCNSKNLIYMIECRKCQKQYIGETKRRLNERFGEHRRSVTKPHLQGHPTNLYLTLFVFQQNSC